MGIIMNVLSIVTGSLFGNIFKERIKFKNFTVFGIAIMIISIVGFFENIFDVNGMILKSNDLLVVVFALIIGTILGDAIQLETKINNISSYLNDSFTAFIDATIFFGVGGMQICGPIMLATVGDNSQLIIKSLIDFPFALMFGISYGKKVLLSSIPVAVVQVIIVLLTILSKTFFDTTVIKQLCAMGYIILFFSGFNLICESKYKINNVNMIIGIFIILLYNVLLKLWR
ncbi:MAG: DUF554 family protein [Clostridia bacterium]|nr:DUF554 family protein [Clostridia bacterium]